MTQRILRVIGWIAGLFIYGIIGDTLDNTFYQVFIGFMAMLGLVYIGLSLPVEDDKVEEVPLNRASRRNPNGKPPVQKFQRVNAKGKQKPGKGRVVKGW